MTRILAVVVTYNPDEQQLAENLKFVRAGAPTLVVDNASANAARVAAIAAELGCTTIRNEINLGLAGALNQAVEALLGSDAEWLATFDQDSCPPPEWANALLAIASKPQGRVGIAALGHVDRTTGQDYFMPGDLIEDDDGWRIIKNTITSGMMVRREVLEAVGTFDEGLFLDVVDQDFILRARKAGFLLVESKTDFLQHSLGGGVNASVLGRKIHLSGHSPLRRYYMVRNNLELFRRYVLFDPQWVALRAVYVAKGICNVLLLEKGRWSKAKAMLAGVRDFALRRFGPRPA